MKQLFYRFRPLNLLIVTITQLAIYYLLLKPIHVANLLHNKVLGFTDSTYFIIILVTCLVCAGGYIINDIFDIEIDKINKPHKVITNPSLWMNIYKSLFIIGLSLTTYLSFACKTIYFLPIFILSWLALYAYSRKLKCTGMWGNLVVAIFSMAVLLALLGPGIHEYQKLDFELIQLYFTSFLLYGLMAFLISLIREIVKDMEDIKGDKILKCATLPVSIGIEKTTIFVSFFQLVLLAVLIAFISYYGQESRYIWVIGLSIIAIWSIFIYRSFYRARGPKRYHAIQSQWKVIMILGLFLLLLEPYIEFWFM